MSKNKMLIALLVIILGIAGVFLYKNKTEIGKSKANPAVSTQTPSESKKELKKLKVTAVADAADTNLLLDFALDKDFYSKHNLAVDQSVRTGKLVDLLLSGQTDVQVGNSVSSVVAYLSGADTVLVANAFQNFSYYGISRYSREEASSIKKAAVNDFGKDGHLVMLDVLKNLGMDPAKVELAAIPDTPGRIAALDQGRVDFILIYSSEKNIVDSGLDKKFHVFSPSEIIKGSSSYKGVITTKKILAEKPEEVKDFVLSIHDALEYMSNNPEEVVEYIKKKYDYSDEESKKFYDLFIQARAGVSYAPDAGSLTGILEFAKKDLKLSDTSRDLSGFVYPDFAKEAINSSAK